MERTKLKIQFIDKIQEPIEYDAELTHINFTFIANLLMQLRKIRKNQIEFIKYLNEDKALESIKSSTPDINVLNLKELIITVKLIKKEKPDPNIEAMINKVKNISSSIDNEIAELKNFQITKTNSSEILSLKSSKSNASYNLNELSREPSLAVQDEENADVIILTANPLCYRYESDKIKELRVMNEFNCITAQIYQVLSRTKLPIKSQFLTLTKNNLSNAIYKKPKILHLICKSTYECDNYKQKSSKLIPNINEINEEIIEAKKESKGDEIAEPQIKKTYSPILLFENEKCQMEKITSNILTKLLKNKSDLTKDITLFISTPLSKDVFNMFTSLTPIKFKNLLVQHSTLADAVYISQFNRDLYVNLLDKKSLSDALSQAKRINFSGYQFCCCSHEHNDDTCLIKKYLSNELFREDEEENKENCDENNKNNIPINQDIKKIPHVYHLRYKCYCQEILREKNANKNNFCYHNIGECENKTNILFGTSKVADICCCQKKKKQIQHNLNGVFQIDKTEEELKKEIIFNEYENEKYKKCVIINKEFVPCYSKMQFKVGFNKILYKIFEFILKKNCNILNIYGNQYDALEIGNLITIIEEFIKERHSYLFLDNQKSCSFNHKESEEFLILNKKDTIDLELGKKNNIKNYMKTDSLDLAVNSQNSAKQLRIDFNNSIKPLLNIIKFDDIKNLGNIFTKRFDNTNKIYIINALKFNDWNSYEWIKKLRTKLDLSKMHIIIFDSNKINEKIEEDNHIEKINYIDFDLLDKYDWMVKNQTHKIEDNKENFENKLIEKGRYLTKEDINEIMNFIIIKKKEESEMYYLILYLFNCTKSGLFAFEFENLFPDKKELNEAVKIRDLYVNKKILNIETNRNTNGNLNKQQQVYIKYIKNKDFISILCDWIKIPENIRQNILGRLFLFYAKKFRLLLEKIKFDRNRINLQKQEINVKGYKPNDSLFSFSAIQSLGIWEPLNNSSEKFKDYTTAPIYNIEGYFNHLSRNFKDIFLNENIKLCSENSNVWNNVKEYLEDISITILTFYKIYDKREILDSITKFKDLFDQFSLSKAALLRLKLFIKMQNDFYNTDISNREKLLNDLKHIENAFTAINNKEGLLETLYAHYINENLNESVILDKIRKILKDMKKEEEDNDKQKKFADIFEAKINYKLLKRKIMKKSPKIEEFEGLFKKLIETFHKNKKKFYVIKTLLLKSLYYMNKIKDKINEDEYKIDFLCYFNSAYFYIDKDTINGVYIDYIKKIAHMKYNLNEGIKVNDIKYAEFKNKISEIFKNYNLGNLNEKNLFSYDE